MLLTHGHLGPADLALGKRIRFRRQLVGLSQSALAERVGVSFQQIQKYERGSNRVASARLISLALALDTTVGQLMGDETSPEADVAQSLLAIPGAIEMVRLYDRISDVGARRALVVLATVLGASDSQGSSAVYRDLHPIIVMVPADED